jgi:hypothetical protein
VKWATIFDRVPSGSHADEYERRLYHLSGHGTRPAHAAAGHVDVSRTDYWT